MSHIFISYSHKDTEYAHALADSLQGIGFTVWVDARLDYGSQWPQEIQKYLDACDAFILIMSPRSFASEWVQSELQRAKRKGKPIFPLLLEGDEPWLSVESTQYYDVRNGKLPDDEFYADLKRAGSPEPAAAKLSQVQGSVGETTPVKDNRSRTGSRAIFAVLGGLAVLCSACLIIGVFLFQRASTSRSPTPSPGGPGVSATALEDPTPPVAFTSTAVPSMPTDASATSLPVQLPDGSQVTMIGPLGEKYQYTVLAAQREPLSPGKLLLNLRIRIWTDFGGGVNFWSDSFRLVVGDVRLAPVTSSNKTVERDVTFDGDVEFEIDASLTDAVVVITVGTGEFPGNTKELRLLFP